MASDEKKYQVFVSSTYHDLQDERQEIMHALLELDCIPSGMELFPAANEDQWSLIKGVIDDCDYYIVVLAGRYGSIGPEGLSYTEMEYRYALKVGKPVIGFVHSDPASLPAKRCESTEEGRGKLAAFRDLVQEKMCKFWTTPQDLGSVVSRSLVKLQRSSPGVGWVRADRAQSPEAAMEMLKLRNRIEELEQQLRITSTEPPKGARGLAQGDKKFSVKVAFRTVKDYENYNWNWSVSATWDQLFFELSPLLVHEANTQQVFQRLTTFIAEEAKNVFELSRRKDVQGHDFKKASVVPAVADLETIVIQFAALGYIIKSEKARSVKDRADYWTLTPYGATVMNQLRAITAAEATETDD